MNGLIETLSQYGGIIHTVIGLLFIVALIAFSADAHRRSHPDKQYMD